MRCVIQRVSRAGVTVMGCQVGEIAGGYVVLIGVEEGDDTKDAQYCADKVAGLRIFEDENGKMNLSIQDVGGQVLAVSQFTLSGDVRHGRRPSFSGAAKPDEAVRLYEAFCDAVRTHGIEVQTGVFQAHMDVSLINDGPVTILLDSKKNF